MYPQVAGFINEIGFPIFVAMFLLISLAKRLTLNTKTIAKNTEVLTELATLIRNINGRSKKS